MSLDPNLPRDAKWQEDLAFLVGKLRDVHPNLYHSIERSEFEAQVDQLQAAIPELSDEEIFVELLRLVALPARERDGHMALSYFAGTGNRIVPLQFFRFADGVFVVRARSEYRSLVGRRLVGIGDQDLAEVDQLIDPLIPRDNENSLIGFRNLTYITPAILSTLGIVKDPHRPVYRFEGPSGEEAETIPSVLPSEYGFEFSYNLPDRPSPPTYLTRRDETFWLAHFETEGMLYLRFNEIRPTSGNEDLEEFGARALRLVNDQDIERVIVDLRQNNGGNNQLIGGMLEFLSDSRIDRPDRLFVFTDRNTFSAAGNFVAVIGDQTSATFVGVSPGGSGSQYGDAERYDLPYSEIAAFIPTRHWVFGDPSSQPLMHPMDVTIEPTSEDFFAGRDPVLDQYLEMQP